MNDNAPEVTFFVPCLNEEKNVAGALDNIAEAMRRTPVRYQVLVFDDCSTDATVDVVEAYAAAHPEMPILIERNEVHRGLGHNYRAGAALVSSSHYMLVNGDNVERPEVISAVVSRIGQADIVIPFFGRLDARPLYRIIISRAFVILVNLLSGTRVRYYNGAVLHRRENVLRYHTGAKGFAYQSELIIELLRRGGTYVEVEVPSQERQFGVSRAFRLWNMISVAKSLGRIAAGRFRSYDTREALE